VSTPRKQTDLNKEGIRVIARWSQLAKFIDKKIGNKKLGEYWKVIRLPVFAGIAISILMLAAAFVPFLGIVISTLGGIAGLLISLYIGWSAIKTHKFDVKHSAIAGGVAGVITGFAGGVVSAITAVAVVGTTMSAMGAYGAAAANAVGGFAMASAISGIILGPVWGAIIGAILAAIGALAAENL